MKRERQIKVRGVNVHNLKGVDLDLPHHRLIAITGVSGSGKSSLAFDTLFAEGQRRYIETFSSYTRQFLETLERPDAEILDGIPPAIAIAQRAGGDRRSSRSTVGTVTELHDSLSLLFAKVGTTFCTRCNHVVTPCSAADVVRAIERLPARSRYMIAFPLEVLPGSSLKLLAESLRATGFTRVESGGKVHSIETDSLPEGSTGKISVIVDRLIRGSEALDRRLDSIETAFAKGTGRCRLIAEGETQDFHRAWICSHCGQEAMPPEPRLFRFNSPLGACPDCDGTGQTIDLNLARIVPDPSRSLAEGAIIPWNAPPYLAFGEKLLKLAPSLMIPTDLPFSSLTSEQLSSLLKGNLSVGYEGLNRFFEALERKARRPAIQDFLSRYRTFRKCVACSGRRLRPEALAVRIEDRSIADVLALRVSEVREFVKELSKRNEDNTVIQRLDQQAEDRLRYLEEIGLGSLTLDRQARTLSGGESQRLALTSALGSGLVNMLYVLDEPSIGLHASDVGRLVTILKSLRDRKNTVVIVEHDLGIVREADLIVDVGPGAGEAGGNILFVGTPEALDQRSRSGETSATGAFLSGSRGPKYDGRRLKPYRGHLSIRGATGHNLKAIDVDFPIGLLCVVTGVSGSGKSTLIEDTLFPAMKRALGNDSVEPEPFREIVGFESFQDVLLIDQGPIGRSSRSNPSTYLKAFDEIRKSFASTHEAKVRNYGAGRFSFNIEGGRCNTCEGSGHLTVDMQFLPDVLIRCAECRGTRYRPETLEIHYRGKNIAEVLDLTVRESFGFFRHRPKIQARLRPLLDVGLDYLRLGQPVSTLSGGEAQRLKLASHLSSSPGAITRAAGKSSTLFLFDEPTTGLHPADTLKLLEALTSLITIGHSLIVIEHSPEVMLSADWIIDLGPGGGEDGGMVVAQGTPEDVARCDTPTGRLLASLMPPAS